MKALRRVPLALGLISAGLAILVARAGPPARAVSPPVTFGQPTISGIGGVGFEQDIRVDTSGRVYTSVPGALSSDTSWVWKSTDDGKTFKWVAAAVPLTGKYGSCAGGGDTERTHFGVRRTHMRARKGDGTCLHRISAGRRERRQEPEHQPRELPRPECTHTLAIGPRPQRLQGFDPMVTPVTRRTRPRPLP